MCASALLPQQYVAQIILSALNDEDILRKASRTSPSDRRKLSVGSCAVNIPVLPKVLLTDDMAVILYFSRLDVL